MQVALFCHTLLSDWDYRSAHFLRGICMELTARGHVMRVFEPTDSWSVQRLVAEQGPNALDAFYGAYPGLLPQRYHLEHLDLEQALCGIDLVLVHERNDPRLVGRIAEHRRRVGSYRLLFHDTHHGAMTDPLARRGFDLSAFDGALVAGRALRDAYLKAGWMRRVWIWHEAADTRVFRPMRAAEPPPGEVIWVGNWADEERTRELHEFFVEPVQALGLRARAHGVGYPAHAREKLAKAGIVYGGWIPNFAVPKLFARFRATVHIPRRPYAAGLRGVPTIRPFEAMACGIPLVSAPWEDSEGLFRPGKDYLVAHQGEEMKRHLRALLSEPELAAEVARSGLESIQARHTCAHRVDELLEIARELSLPVGPCRPRASSCQAA